MTEIPEHLLQRSREARQRLTGEAPAAAAAPEAAPTESANAPAVVGDAAPQVKAPVPLPEIDAPPPPPPEDPWVTAAKDRQKIPMWVMPVLLFLPIWLILYVGTLENPTREEGVLFTGGEVYAEHCASCHGAGGAGGGAFPGFTNGEIHETFDAVEAQVAWVVHGTIGYQDNGIATYGDIDKPVGGSGAVMPAFGVDLTARELIAAVFYERIELGGDTDPSELAFAEMVYEAMNAGELDGEAHFVEGSDGDLTGRGIIASYFAEAREATGVGADEVAGG